ncbi:MarR family winged helix-turn-helix transcriptional regulator [Rubellimicrobium arenae]|uniref:MarR family winged helix-turn-helix transcriptional regulator n=1 Tax=Rubellimicrobium arenae TaxID=2817372 RepID=UPI001B301C46|nr:MarR family transcriptional regulator [Rubellimicrobium arenae]
MRDVPARERFGFQFSVLARQWRRTVERQLAQVGLSDASWRPLIHLAESGDGITQKDLAIRVGVDDSSLVRLLDILERKGLLVRQVGQGDRRVRLILLTEAGREEVARIRRLLAVAEAELLSGLSDQEIESMLGGFDRIRQRLRDLEAAQDGT